MSDKAHGAPPPSAHRSHTTVPIRLRSGQAVRVLRTSLRSKDRSGVFLLIHLYGGSSTITISALCTTCERSDMMLVGVHYALCSSHLSRFRSGWYLMLKSSNMALKPSPSGEAAISPTITGVFSGK